MTSSLVGSEMCIRDSARMVHKNREDMADKLWTTECEVCGQSFATRGKLCLLYTSDAADDM
eukprot:11551312-Prorocentrum_lima.AAC.1